ncbi:MAG: hypothetical protein ACK40X_08340, partial [Armatimonadota bacterium]
VSALEDTHYKGSRKGNSPKHKFGVVTAVDDLGKGQTTVQLWTSPQQRFILDCVGFTDLMQYFLGGDEK